MKKSKLFVFQSLILMVCMLIFFGGITVYVDPYFHYHKPLDNFQYPINNERYQNDGITRHWEYDAVITGSSMTECFKTSEFDKLFGVQSVKVPYSGALFKEIDEVLNRAIERNSSIKVIVRGIDTGYMIADKDAVYSEMCPEYLYDENPFNDVSYIFNKEVLVKDVTAVVEHTSSGKLTTSFDEYVNWSADRMTGKEEIMKQSPQIPMNEYKQEFDETIREMLHSNIEQNVVQTVKANPDIQFYFFFPPYSIYWWDSRYRHGLLERQIDAEKYAIEMLLPYDNVHLYSFFDDFELICNTDLYIDNGHYTEEVNSQILMHMKNGEHKLTWDNYLDYCEKVEDFYLNYDYESLWK